MRKLFIFIKDGGPIIWGTVLVLFFMFYQQVDHYSHHTYLKYKPIAYSIIERDTLGNYTKIILRSDSVFVYSTATDELLESKIIKRKTVTK